MLDREVVERLRRARQSLIHARVSAGFQDAGQSARDLLEIERAIEDAPTCAEAAFGPEINAAISENLHNQRNTATPSWRTCTMLDHIKNFAVGLAAAAGALLVAAVVVYVIYHYGSVIFLCLMGLAMVGACYGLGWSIRVRLVRDGDSGEGESC